MSLAGQESGHTTTKIDIGTSNSLYPSATAISNREYEDREQVKKRQIKLLSPGVLPALLEEFQSLISQ